MTKEKVKAVIYWFERAKMDATQKVLTSKHIDTAIESLKKQMPKKPIYFHHCPSCEASLPEPKTTGKYCSCCYYPKYCMHCGQRVDWSEV